MGRLIKMTPFRFALLMTGFVGSVSAVMYSVFIYPMQNIEYYKERQKENRAGLVQEDIQPGNMRVWSDPFGRRKPRE